MTHVVVDNYYDNTKLDITLDPKLDPKANAQKYYQKYQKAKNILIEHTTTALFLSLCAITNAVSAFSIRKFPCFFFRQQVSCCIAFFKKRFFP